jgi:serine/threonine protein kinase
MSALPSIQGVELGERLGEGAFGSVYKARHRLLDVDVAVKIIDSTRIQNPAALDLAISEARLMARLDHPNLLRILDAGRVEHLVYLTLELMDGTCEKTRNLQPAVAMDFTQQLLGGVQALHEARIIHRDIKPANCLLRSRDGRVKLADLGIAVEEASRTTDYNFAGTLPFMPPEVFESPPRFGPRSDLYALGMTLACMFLDADPFPLGSRSELFAWIMGDARPRVSSLRADVPGRITSIVDRMIARNAEMRPQSAAEALASLSEVASIKTTEIVRDVGAETQRNARTIGTWLLGEKVYTSSNWTHYAVSHIRTGAPGRLAEVRPDGVLQRATKVILESAARASALRHHNIIDVLDWGVDNNRTYVVTAPQGRTLEQLVVAQGALDEFEAIAFALSLADALAYLHDRKLVYQIVDPGSAVVSANARYGQLAWPLYCVPTGTPATDDDENPIRVWVGKWAPPEVIFEPDKGTIDVTVDLYGLGETLFYLLAGTNAFSGLPTPAALAYAKLERVPNVREKLPLVTAPTAALIRRLLDADVAKRPTSASEVRDELAWIAGRLSPTNRG